MKYVGTEGLYSQLDQSAIQDLRICLGVSTSQYHAGDHIGKVTGKLMMLKVILIFEPCKTPRPWAFDTG
jgi:hypothetical protein